MALEPDRDRGHPTIPFHQQLMDDDRFRNGDFDTRFLDDFEMEPAPAAA